MEYASDKLLTKKVIVYTCIALILFLLLLFRSEILFFLVVLLISAKVNYFLHAAGIHIHLGHVTFFNVLFSYKLGFWYGFIFILGGHVIPEVLTGHIDIEMFLSFFIYTIIALLVSIFSFVSFIPLAITLIIIQTASSFIFGTMMGTSITELLTEHGTEHIFVMIWYNQFGGIVMMLLS